MRKPTLFFSHSSQDQAALIRLKSHYCVKTGGSIDVFLSSDGQSIPLGTNWIHAVEEALDSSAIMIVFVTASSLRSSWLYFEAGYAYCKKLKVVPVGFLGADLDAVPPPLSLLQGFNISNEGGLNNLIALSNRHFGHNHQEAFTAAEFQAICRPSAPSEHFNYAKVVNQARVALAGGRDFECTSASLLDSIHAIFIAASVDCQKSKDRLDIQGLSIVCHDQQGPDGVTVNIEGAAFEHVLPLLTTALRSTCRAGLAGKTFVLDLAATVRNTGSHHQLTGQFIGTEIRLAAGAQLLYRDITFSLGWRPGTGPLQSYEPYMVLTLANDEWPVDQFQGLFSTLAERRVVVAHRT